MHWVKPQAIMIADSQLVGENLEKMISQIGAPEWMSKSPASGGEELIEVGGRLCYKAFGVGLNANVTKVREGNKEYLENILKQHHGSVLEHASVSFVLLNVSRILTHELVRHRAGTAFSQESGRFVRIDDIGMYLPKVFSEEALQAYYPFVENPQKTVAHWAHDQAAELKRVTEQLVKEIEDRISSFAEVLGLDNASMPFALKKRMTSALRRLAPNGMSTHILVTANHRAWRHMIEQRTSPGAEEEIIEVFVDVARQMKISFPAIYQDMSWVEIDGNTTITFGHSKV